MPLILETCKDNSLEFKHADGSATLFYKDPSTNQRIDYSNRMIKRKGNKIKNEIAATRLAGGYAICTGLGEGDFAIPANNEQGFKLISSDPKSEYFTKDWKRLLHKYQSNYLMLLGAHVFESATIEGDLLDDEDEIDSLDDKPDQSEKPPVLAEDIPSLDDELGK